MNYFISDLHIGHKNVLNCEGSSNFDGRNFKTFDEMNEAILKNVNSVVKNDDHLYLLGDILWKETEENIALISQFKGNLHAIKGNHCQFKDARYRRLFCEICDYKEITDNIKGKNYGVVLSHFPIMFWNKMKQVNNDGSPRTKNYNILLYGHAHNSNEEKLYQQFLKYVNDNYGYGAMAFNVGCMMSYMNYTPRTLEEIITANTNVNKNVDTLDK